MTPVTVRRGDGPLVLGLPHTGTFVPDEIWKNLNEAGRNLADTDWHIDRLYAGLRKDVTTVTANFHRYVVDANRDPSGVSLYPGQTTTGLVPLTDFDGAPIWQSAPTEAEIAQRRAAFHAPYHAALTTELTRVHAQHGIAVLYDCHSIRSRIPYLFEGRLPDFNIGTNLGVTCAPPFQDAVQDICEAAKGYTSTLNGRFKGGWTTRHYGQPAQGIHAIQMELAQSTYLREECAPWVFDAAKAAPLRAILTQILDALHATATEMTP